MKLFRVSSITIMIFILLITTSGTYAQQVNGPPQASGLCTDGQSLFVMAGATLYQYSVLDLSLITSVALPKLAPPPGIFGGSNSGITSNNNETQPPPPPAGSDLTTDGTYLFMLRGHSLQQYTVSNMALVKSVELPKPESPTVD